MRGIGNFQLNGGSIKGSTDTVAVGAALVVLRWCRGGDAGWAGFKAGCGTREALGAQINSPLPVRACDHRLAHTLDDHRSFAPSLQLHGLER
eukprot:CAMPEP_0181235108 /NCGR_PEP_ID=MMETSP1096-20121128/37381_1 /TAXON_ID=156174 ORGANISM="Chrysochromulina ericina, Strain CCMP281" /NCGR_SAMPLE_ID=MMETSP1096 /ASSEMBLY_ACC=CAM_ASM_000453 /LENGTH=91 /DNA_ID=CAMNT_0023330029 /DNA_START=114 /DNA_END=389 /DNA_ORIENTATION=-